MSSSGFEIETRSGKKIVVRLVDFDNGTKNAGLVQGRQDNGEMVWTVKPDTPGEFFVEIKWVKPNIIAWSWNGYMYTISPEDGSIINIEFVK